MGEVISTFHVDVRLLVAQVVNFAIVFVVLYYFGIRPLLKILQERSQKIDDSLTNAAKIEKELAATKSKRSVILADAKKEANEMLQTVSQKAEARKKEMMAKAKEEIADIVSQTKEDLQIEKQIALKHIKMEAADLVMAAVEKVLEKKLDAKQDEEFIQKILTAKKD